RAGAVREDQGRSVRRAVEQERRRRRGRRGSARVRGLAGAVASTGTAGTAGAPGRMSGCGHPRTLSHRFGTHFRAGGAATANIVDSCCSWKTAIPKTSLPPEATLERSLARMVHRLREAAEDNLLGVATYGAPAKS